MRPAVYSLFLNPYLTYLFPYHAWDDSTEPQIRITHAQRSAIFYSNTMATTPFADTLWNWVARHMIYTCQYDDRAEAGFCMGGNGAYKYEIVLNSRSYSFSSVTLEKTNDGLQSSRMLQPRARTHLPRTRRRTGSLRATFSKRKLFNEYQ